MSPILHISCLFCSLLGLSLAVLQVDNFVRAFRSSEAIIVCVTSELIKDAHCMNCLHLALSSSKPLSKYVFVVFDGTTADHLPRRLRHLLAPKSPARRLDWQEKNPQQFWQSMRRALSHTSGHAMCAGKQTSTDFIAGTSDA